MLRGRYSRSPVPAPESGRKDAAFGLIDAGGSGGRRAPVIQKQSEATVDALLALDDLVVQASLLSQAFRVRR